MPKRKNQIDPHDAIFMIKNAPEVRVRVRFSANQEIYAKIVKNDFLSLFRQEVDFEKPLSVTNTPWEMDNQGNIWIG